MRDIRASAWTAGRPVDRAEPAAEPPTLVDGEGVPLALIWANVGVMGLFAPSGGAPAARLPAVAPAAPFGLPSPADAPGGAAQCAPAVTRRERPRTSRHKGRQRAGVPRGCHSLPSRGGPCHGGGGTCHRVSECETFPAAVDGRLIPVGAVRPAVHAGHGVRGWRGIWRVSQKSRGGGAADNPPAQDSLMVASHWLTTVRRLPDCSRAAS
jgi:hypothetical protein